MSMPPVSSSHGASGKKRQLTPKEEDATIKVAQKIFETRFTGDEEFNAQSDLEKAQTWIQNHTFHIWKSVFILDLSNQGLTLLPQIFLTILKLKNLQNSQLFKQNELWLQREEKPHLDTLDLSGNQFNSLPEELKYCPLKELDLRNNPNLDSLPDWLE